MAGIAEVGTAYVNIIPKADGFSAALSKAGSDGGTQAGDAFNGAFSGGLKKLGGAVAALGIGSAVGNFLKDSISVGMEFDSAMSQVAATMGTTVDEISELREFAQEMGSTTAFSASQAAEALNYMALAGYDAETSMQMLPNVLNLAAAGGMELATASDMITDAQSALGLSLDETSAMVDQMAAASSKTNTSVEQLGSAILTVGGTAKTLSGGTVELSQALGLLADNGIKGAEGGTALRNVLLGLSSDKFESTFGELGVAAYDAEGNMRSLKDIFADMNAAMADWTVEEKTKGLSEAFNKVDLKSLNALLATDAERWDEVSAAIEDSAGAAEQMADTQLDNLSGDVTIFQSALEGLQIAISDAVSPALRSMVQVGTAAISGITEALGFLYEASAPVREAISNIIAGIGERLGPVVEDAQPLLQGLGDIVGGAVGAAFDGLATAVTIVADAIGWLWDNVLAPFGQWLSETFGPLIEGVGTVIGGIGDFIGGAMQTASGAVSSYGDAMVSSMGGDWQAMALNTSQTFSGVQSNVSSAMAAASSAAQTTASEVDSALEFATTPTDVGDTFDEVAINMQEPIDTAVSDIESKPDEITSYYSGLGQSITNAVGTIDFPTPHVSYEYVTAGDDTVKLPVVNWYAHGGFVDGATLIGAGEAGPEMILPRSGSLMDEFAEAVASKSGTVNVYLQYDASDDANAMARGIATALGRIRAMG